MKQPGGYKTKQKEQILQYLTSHEGEHVTAQELSRHLEDEGTPVGTATIYRHLESLVDEGIIKKYSIDGNSPACFEYVEPESHEDAEICFHCKCEKCGRLIHLHCDELNEMQSHLMADHRFKLNPVRTVFYGLCEQCIRRNQAKTKGRRKQSCVIQANPRP